MIHAWITGAAGMLGRTLTEHLLEQGVAVTAVVREGTAKCRLWSEHPRLQVIECNLEHLAGYRPGEDARCDWFFHFAWAGTTGDSRNDMMLQTRNIQNTLDAVELAHRLGAALFLGAGSQAEYGRVEGILTPQTPTKPENGYGMGKLCAGQMSRQLCSSYGIRFVWMRIVSVYGPYNVENSLIMSGIRSLLDGKRFSCTKGEQLWDYLYAKDAAKAFAAAAKFGKDGAVYCLGSGKAMPLAEYIHRMKDAIDPTAEVGFGDIPYGPGQVMHLCADLSQLTADTGFIPEYTFEKGIRETIQWVKNTRVTV